jgi:L-arabinose isomerase
MTNKQIWFLTGSQHLYGPETLKQVEENSIQIVKGLNDTGKISIEIVFKKVLTDPEAITKICLEASQEQSCIGLITWMHTFSPAKMWINGLTKLTKPILHLHTQFNKEIPWSTIDMNFMNLNQAAHGDREYGFMMSRLRMNRKIVVGHWSSSHVQSKIDIWARVANGACELRNLKLARIGDNMREVAVTEGDKVEAQMKFGFSINGYDTDDVQSYIDNASSNEIEAIISSYDASYEMGDLLKIGGSKRASLEDAAKIEIGLRKFLENGGFKAYTDTFENLGRFKQLPGIASQRLMADGYGFGGEGDWKTSAMLRAFKVMATGLPGGTSFMEDYTYHFSDTGSIVLGSHMLEICPSIADGIVKCEIHPLGIGGKEDPVRLVFNGSSGPAINISLVDMGNRFRLIVNLVDAISPPHDLPKLPTARVFWKPQPSLEIGGAAWIMAGGAHHTVYSTALGLEYVEDFANMMDIELLVIDQDTKLRQLEDQIRANEVYFGNKK